MHQWGHGCIRKLNGCIRKLIFEYYKTIFGNWDGGIRKLGRLYSETGGISETTKSSAKTIKIFPAETTFISTYYSLVPPPPRPTPPQKNYSMLSELSF